MQLQVRHFFFSPFVFIIAPNACAINTHYVCSLPLTF